MSNRQKTIKKAALARQREANTVLRCAGVSLADVPIQIGIILKHMEVSHLNLLAVNSINNASGQLMGVDLVVLTESSNAKPFEHLLCPVMGWKDIEAWKSPLIVVSAIGFRWALRSLSPVIILYLFDIDMDEIDEIRNYANDSRVQVVTRTQEYAELLRYEFNVDVRVIGEFNVPAFMALVTEKKNADSTNSHG